LDLLLQHSALALMGRFSLRLLLVDNFKIGDGRTQGLYLLLELN
jgi:hypothetical protein